MSDPTRPELTALQIADPPERWDALGFAVHDSRMQLGGIDIRLGASGHGITGWRVSGLELALLDGLQTIGDAPAPPETAHPNGAIAVDHVVVVTPNFDRTAAALTEAGMPLRRIREQGSFRQGFRRLGPAILELVDAGAPNADADDSAHFWGLVVIVEDLDALADRLGDRLGSIRAAVQPGRRIATLTESAGLSPRVAFMDPEPAAGAGY